MLIQNMIGERADTVLSKGSPSRGALQITPYLERGKDGCSRERPAVVERANRATRFKTGRPRLKALPEKGGLMIELAHYRFVDFSRLPLLRRKSVRFGS